MNKSLAIAMGANTLGLTAHTTYMYYLAPIMLREGGVIGGDAIIFSLIAVAMGLAVVPAGRLADRIPRRYVMRLGIALLGLSYGALLVPPSLAAACVGTVASGVGLALLFVSFQSYVADLLRAEERVGAYARAGALAVLATALGPFIAALALRGAPDVQSGLHRSAFLFGAAAFFAVSLTLLLPSVRVVRPTPDERGQWTDALRAAGPIMILYVLMGLGYGMTAPYFTVYFLDNIGLANETWGYLLALGTLLSAIGAILAGSVSRRLPPPPVAMGGMFGLMLSTLVFVFPVPVFGLILGFLGRSLFSTTVGPGMNSILMARARVGRRAEAQAYGSLAWNVGWAIGGASGAFFLAKLGGATFAVGGAIAFVGVSAGSLLLRTRQAESVSPK